MKKRRFLILLLASLAPLYVPAKPSVQSETVLCYGDSITYGRFPEGGVDETNNWVALLGDDPVKLKTVNSGKNGRRTEDLGGLRDALKKTPDATRVILLLGTNDLGKDATTDASVKNMQAMIAEVRKTLPKAEILLVSPTDVISTNLTDWWKTNRGVGEQTPAHIEILEVSLRHLAKTEKTGFLSLRGVVPAEHFPDGVHPDKEGHRLIAEAMRKALAES